MRHLIAALAATVALAAAPPPRETVDEIAAKISEVYFDRAKSAAIAEALHAEAAAGTYDGYTDPVDLADALTARLRPEDGHFRVQWGQDSGGEAQAQDAPATVPFGVQVARMNYGFRGVERLAGNVALIDIRAFAPVDTSDANDPAFIAANAALASVRDADAVIVDLSNSRGGAPQMVGYLLSAFLDPKADVYNTFQTIQGEMSEKPPIPYAAPRPDVPLFVLTGSTTGSGAESFAYTLQAAKRAVLVGATTAGRANPGDNFPLKSGFQIFISVAEPRNPVTGGNWEKTGVQPEVAVPVTEARDRAHAFAIDEILKKNPPAELRTELEWARAALEPRPSAAAEITPADYPGRYGELEIVLDGSAVTLTKPGRAPWTLMPLEKDLFYVANDLTKRVRFLRGENGVVESLEEASAYGQVTRSKREG